MIYIIYIYILYVICYIYTYLMDVYIFWEYFLYKLRIRTNETRSNLASLAKSELTLGKHSDAPEKLASGRPRCLISLRVWA